MSNTQAVEQEIDAAASNVEANEVVSSGSNDDSFEVDAIQRRVAARKIAREIERKKKEAEDELQRHLMERAMRARQKPAPVEVPSFWARARKGLIAGAKSKTFHHSLIGGSLAIMVGWLGVHVYELMEKRADAAFRAHCRENNLSYATGSQRYCYDEGRFARQITDYGVSGRMDLDWSLNQHELRLAAKAADRANPKPIEFVVAGPVAQAAARPAGAGPVAAEPARLTPVSVAELAAQIMRAPSAPPNMAGDAVK